MRRAASLLGLPLAVMGCSTVVFPMNDSLGVAVGRTMEYNMPSGAYQLSVRPAGHNISSHFICKLAGIPSSGGGFTTKYGFASIDLLWSVTEGMNQHGLTVSMQIMKTANYTGVRNNGTRRSVCYPDIAGWLLGSFKTVNESLAGLADIDVTPGGGSDIMNAFASRTPLASVGQAETGTGMHWSISDVSGRSVAVEYIQGKLRHYDIYRLGVMSNDPGYGWHIRNAAKYGLKGLAESEDRPGNISCQSALAHGIPADSMPTSRFVRLAYLREQVLRNTKPQGIEGTVAAIEGVLGNVYIPIGTVARGKGVTELVLPYERTAWTIIKLARQRLFLFKTNDDWQWRMVNISAIPWQDLKANTTQLPRGDGMADGNTGWAPAPPGPPLTDPWRVPAGSLVSIPPLPVQSTIATATTETTTLKFNGTETVGRNVDWTAEEQKAVLLAVHPKGEARGGRCDHGPGGDAQAVCSWTSKLGFAGMERGGSVFEGVNTAGLSVSALQWHPSALVPPGYAPHRGPVGRACRNITDVAAWLLGTCRNVTEAAAALRNVTVYLEGPGTGVHWAIHDANGAAPWSTSLVAEYPFVDENDVVSLRVTDNTIHPRKQPFNQYPFNQLLPTPNFKAGVLTDGGDYAWQVQNIDNYAGVQSVELDATLKAWTVSGSKPQMLSHGGNLLGMPAGYGDDDRFIRLFYLRLFALNARMGQWWPKKHAKSVDDMNTASALLANVAVPGGAVCEEDGSACNTTTFTVITQPEKRCLFYRGGGDSRWHVVNLTALDMSKVSYRLIAQGSAGRAAAGIAGSRDVTAEVVTTARSTPANRGGDCCSSPMLTLFGDRRAGGMCPGVDGPTHPVPVPGCDGCVRCPLP